jgi:uncharacterized protein (TIGR02996 family)
VSVFFVYRCHYDLPATKYLKRFEDATLLDWFRNHWKLCPDYYAAGVYLEKLIGWDLYGFPSLLDQDTEDEDKPKAPKTVKDLQDLIERHLSVEGPVLFKPHVIQWLTDDDENEMACCVFDDHFLAKHPERAAYLLHEDWELPANAGTGGFTPKHKTNLLAPRGRWEGMTYLMLEAAYEACSLTDLSGSVRLEGVRLPQLAPYLAEADPDEDQELDWPLQLLDLRDQLFSRCKLAPTEKAFLREIRANPKDDTHWNVYGDWLEERGHRRAELTLLERALAAIGSGPPASLSRKPRRTKSRWRVEEHLAQLSLHTDVLTYPRGGKRDTFDNWFLFDDLWASAHPDLANALLCHELRWDVLSNPRTPTPED